MQAAQSRIQLGSNHEIGELTGKQIDGDERHGHQEDHRDHADENISHDQPVAQAPEHLGLEPPKGQNRKHDDGENTENSYPSTERLTEGNLEYREESLQGEQEQIQPQEITGSAGQPGARQYISRQKSKTQCAERQVHAQKRL